MLQNQNSRYHAIIDYFHLNNPLQNRGTVGSTDIKRRTRTILEELNLGEVRHTRVSELTDSERRRLHIAIHLLLDTELLILDQPLQGLDIFDAFFLVEYLRQWAAIGGRSVIMTISPPTYEVCIIFPGKSLYNLYEQPPFQSRSSLCCIESCSCPQVGPYTWVHGETSSNTLPHWTFHVPRSRIPPTTTWIWSPWMTSAKRR